MAKDKRSSYKAPYPVILASASPRRSELLRNLIEEFEVVPSNVVEEEFFDADPWRCAQRISREKAMQVFNEHPNHLVISGDTVVALEQNNAWVQFAKPADATEATQMIASLSGREHVVITGYCLRWPKGMVSATATTKVQFRAISAEEIAEYVAGPEPYDKAGGYGIQGEAKKFLSKLEGSIENVIGFPVEAIQEALKEVN